MSRAPGSWRLGGIRVRRAQISGMAGVGVLVGLVSVLSLPVGIGLLAAAVVATGVGTYQALRARLATVYRQSEAMLSLVTALRPAAPLPPLRGWAISPDLGVILVDHILEARPERVLECGCGVSTVILALALERAGRGSLISLEHDPEHARRVERDLERHGVADRVTIVRAPLMPVAFGGFAGSWYDVEEVESRLDTGTRFDLVLVDGPPAALGSRYPVLPLLGGFLGDEAVLVIDDADRRVARRELERWREDDPGLSVRHVATEKGATIVRPTRGEGQRSDEA